MQFANFEIIDFIRFAKHQNAVFMQSAIFGWIESSGRGHTLPLDYIPADLRKLDGRLGNLYLK